MRNICYEKKVVKIFMCVFCALIFAGVAIESNQNIYFYGSIFFCFWAVLLSITGIIENSNDEEVSQHNKDNYRKDQ